MLPHTSTHKERGRGRQGGRKTAGRRSVEREQEAPDPARRHRRRTGCATGRATGHRVLRQTRTGYQGLGPRPGPCAHTKACDTPHEQTLTQTRLAGAWLCPAGRCQGRLGGAQADWEVPGPARIATQTYLHSLAHTHTRAHREEVLERERAAADKLRAERQVELDAHVRQVNIVS